MTTEQQEVAGTPRVGLVETEDGMVAFVVEELGVFAMSIEDWQACFRNLGYQLRKRSHLERLN